LDLKVIPVIDILNGVVVHAVKGQRREYKPIQSKLTTAVEPLAVAKTFKNLGFKDLYIADLDAIIDCSTNFGVLSQIAEETGLRLIVDAGITSLERAKRLLDAGVSKVVIGTETLQNKNFVAEAVKAFGNERIIVSLDLKGEKVLVKIGFSGCLNPLCLLGEFKEMGISSVIVLDLALVGSGEGVNVDFLKKAKAKVEMDLYVGGGVRDVNDIVELDYLGISGVLVASALHSGKITVDELRQKMLL
jgi:phosphoribosylformimino-5-aminoimidazole carboxamide ribotide isomerase